MVFSKWLSISRPAALCRCGLLFARPILLSGFGFCRLLVILGTRDFKLVLVSACGNRPFHLCIIGVVFGSADIFDGLFLLLLRGRRGLAVVLGARNSVLGS